MTYVKIETGSRIPPPDGPFRSSFWGHISAPNQDIFTKFGGCVGNEFPQGVEWSKHVSFGNPIWQTAAMHHTCNILEFWERISAPDQNIFMEFGEFVSNGLSKCVEWFKYYYFENPVWRTSAMYHTYNIPAVNFNVVD